MENVVTASTQEAAQETKSKKLRTKPYWMLDLNNFVKVWSLDGRSNTKDRTFKQIGALICILKNITPSNNTLAVTHKAIADEAGVSQDTVSRMMQRLCEKNFLQKKRGGLYIVNPYIMMRGPDKPRLPALYRSYLKVKEENLEKEQEGQSEQNKQGEQPLQDVRSGQNTSDAVTGSLAQAGEETAKPAPQKQDPPVEEYSYPGGHYWKITLSDFSRIWYNGRSKKKMRRPVNQDFKQLTVLAYILQRIIPADNTLRVTYQETSDDTGVSKDVVLQIMRRLQKGDFLQKKRNGLYVVNPYALMMGNRETKTSKLYQSYCAAKQQNTAKKEREDQKQLEADADCSKGGNGARRGRKRKNSVIPPEIIIDGPSADDEFDYWEEIGGVDEDEMMTMEDMDLSNELLKEAALAGVDFDSMESYRRMAEAEGAQIAAEQNGANGD